MGNQRMSKPELPSVEEPVVGSNHEVVSGLCGGLCYLPVLFLSSHILK